MSSKNTFRLLFFVNKSKQNKEGAPILLRITINGSKVAMNTRRRIQLTDWNTKLGMPHQRNAFCDDLYMYLETLRNKTYTAFTELLREYDDVTPTMVRNYLQGIQSGSSKTILDIWQEHNEELKPLIGKQCSYALWQKHNIALKHFTAFLRAKYRMSDMWRTLRNYSRFIWFRRNFDRFNEFWNYDAFWCIWYCNYWGYGWFFNSKLF